MISTPEASSSVLHPKWLLALLNQTLKVIIDMISSVGRPAFLDSEERASFSRRRRRLERCHARHMSAGDGAMSLAAAPAFADGRLRTRES